MIDKAKLAKHLEENTGVLGDGLQRDAFLAVDRADFVPEEYQVEAYEDYPLPIGFGQTISQPTTVFFMLELLSPGKGHSILDIGSGSGWTTALLAHIVGEEGKVVGLEVIPGLVEMGQKNLGKYGFPWAKIWQAERGEVGLPSEGPFDRILVSAEFFDEVPQKLIDQLKPGGILVAPAIGSIVKIHKRKDGEVEKDIHEGFAFVPYVS